MNEHRKPILGELIEARLKAVGITKAEFGRRINTSRQNVSLILKKASMDTELLRKISEVLDHDFFAHLRPPDNMHRVGVQRVEFVFQEVRVKGVMRMTED